MDDNRHISDPMFRSSISEHCWAKHAMNTILMSCLCLNQMSTVSHCYGSVLCSNLQFFVVCLLIFGVLKCWTRHRTAHAHHLLFSRDVNKLISKHPCDLETITGLVRTLNRLQYRLSIEMFFDSLRQS